ncbi:MAG: electron transfer flavoprotein subunit alpha/FixB family protein [Anaerolineae bacterium]|nr:electron transfer flavoprotein subunit alpha/FixB family protein [Anaerolineae bacterium]
MSGDILVFSEKMGLLAELITAARELCQHSGGKLAALVLGPRAEAQAALSRGADRVLWVGELPQGRLVDDVTPTLAGLVEQSQPYAVLVGATRRGRAIAGRLAGRLNVTALTDVLQFSFEDDQLQARHMIFGGGAVRVDRPLSSPVVATVGAGVFSALPTDGSGGGGEIREVPFVEPVDHMKLRERRPRPAPTVNLAGAKRVVCVGRGVAQRDDLALAEQLARALSAEIACTRPLAEGLDWLPHERYIGISGATIRPDLYLGVGVSGQVQHWIGMSRSKIVAAINKDQHAPIFQQADYGIVGDLYQVVPALLKALEAKRNGG